MPIAGHDYGIDTDRPLKDLNWANIQQQRNANPRFAGRYFNPHVGVTWVDGETTDVKAANPNLNYIFPMQNPGLVKQTYRTQGMDHIIVEIDPPRKGARAGAVTVSSGAITGISVYDGGMGYTAAPAVHIASRVGAGAAASAIINAQGVVTRINVTAGGAGYRADVKIVVTVNAPPAGRTARAGAINLSPTGEIRGIAVDDSGSGYKQAPKVVIRGGDSAATATSKIDAAGKVISIDVTQGGSGYKEGIRITIDPPPPGGTAARAGAATLSPAGAMTRIPVLKGGSGYPAPPAVHITSDTGAGATATAAINAAGEVTAIAVNRGGAYRFADPDFVCRWGDVDAAATCSRIWDVVKGGELLFPEPRSVIVYLDIESGVILSPNYWYGWASKVYWFCTGCFTWPFYPGLYCTTQHNPAGGDVLHRIPSDDVQNGLTLPPNSCSSKCWGVFATNPQLANRFNQNFQPDWKDRFDDWTQTVHVIFGLFSWKLNVKVLLWQYGMQVPNGPPAFNALHVDLDETSPGDEAVRRMLRLP